MGTDHAVLSLVGLIAYVGESPEQRLSCLYKISLDSNLFPVLSELDENEASLCCLYDAQ